MCTSPQVITLLPLLCRTPACISAHLNRASLNIHVRAVCIISLKAFTSQPPTHYSTAHSCLYVHNLDLHKHPIWAEACFLRLLLKAPSVAISPGAPVRPVWARSIRLKNQPIAPTPEKELRQNLTATFTHNIKSMLRSETHFLLVHAK